MKKLLWIGDAGCPSGFARATHETLDVLRYYYDVTVLGMNYRGDPHSYPYPIWACAPGGDAIGIGRLIWMCDLVKPDVIVLQNDSWNIQHYLQQLARFPEYASIPVVASLAVDGLNIRAEWLRGLSHAIFWTEFGKREARKGGYTGPATVIPLGVDVGVYYPMDRREVRARRIPSIVDAFIVGNVNRNQPRKRWDLAVRYFARWIKQLSGEVSEDRLRRAPVVIRDAFLYLHTAPTGDLGVNVKELARYYGVLDRLALVEPQIFYGIPEDEMRDTDNCFDVCMTTTQGEGMGLTTMEAMACGVPCIVPRWAALGDWAKDAALQVPCTSAAINPVAPGLNIIGGVADEMQFVAGLDHLYRSREAREDYAARGRALMAEPRFRWTHIGLEWLKVLDSVVETPDSASETEAAWTDLGRPVEVITKAEADGRVLEHFEREFQQDRKGA